MSYNFQADREAEEAIIAHCLNVPSDSARMLSMVRPGDLFTDDCKLAYERITELVAAREEVNVVSLSAGGVRRQWLLDIVVSVVTAPASLDYWVQFVQRQGKARRLLSEVSKAARDITQGADPDEVSAFLAETLRDAPRTASRTRSLQDVIESEGYPSMISWMDAPHRLAGPATGIQKLDTYLGGLGAGRLIALGADTGVGKSAFVQHLARECSKELVPIHIVSTEMSDTEVFFRLAFMEAGWDKLQVAVRGHTRDDEKRRMLDAMETLRGRPVYLTELRGMDIGSFEAEAHRIREKHGTEVLILDLLNGLPTTGENRAQGIAQNTARLKQIAEAERFCLLMTAHINRDSAKGMSELGIHSFKDSGAIEQDADQAMILVPIDESGNRLSREETSRLANAGESVEVAIRLCKNRHGAEGTIKTRLHWGHGGRFYSAA